MVKHGGGCRNRGNQGNTGARNVPPMLGLEVPAATVRRNVLEQVAHQLGDSLDREKLRFLPPSNRVHVQEGADCRARTTTDGCYLALQHEACSPNVLRHLCHTQLHTASCIAHRGFAVPRTDGQVRYHAHPLAADNLTWKGRACVCQRK